MKRALISAIILFCTFFVWRPVLAGPPSGWPGVDETVIEPFARQAGRPAREPYLNTDRGDLLLSLFLLAGLCGGFAAGYFYRELFPPKPTRETGDA